MTAQPGGDLLVGDDLGVSVTRPGQRHDEDPRAQQLAGTPVDDLRTLAEVDLRRLAGLERQHGGHLRVSGLQTGEEPAHRGVRAGEAVAAHQGAVDGGALDPFAIDGMKWSQNGQVESVPFAGRRRVCTTALGREEDVNSMISRRRCIEEDFTFKPAANQHFRTGVGTLDAANA